MARVVYAVPYAPPLPVASPWPGMRFQWTGWDGSEWNIGDRASGVYLRGARGLLSAPVRRYTSESAALPGSTFEGSQTLEREVFWELSVFSDAGSQAWIDYDRAFWRTMDEQRPGTWTVTQPNGEARALTCRFVGDDDPMLDTDPSRLGWGRYGVTLVAENPYWAGTLVSKSFRSSDPLDFLPSTGGPPFRVSEGSLTTGATIANPGDVPAQVEWWLTNTTTATVGVGGRTAVVPFAVASGRLLVIDTRSKSAVEIDAPPLVGGNEQPLDVQQEWVAAHLPTGTKRTTELGSATRWGAIPAAAQADLSIALTGTGAMARASLVPQFKRAW